MKNISLSLSALLCGLVLTFSACIKDTCSNNRSFVVYDPVFRTIADIRAVTPQYQTARPLKNPGKIYFYGDYVLINEQKEGIHIFDNTNPKTPVNKGFIAIEGNVDMAIKEDVLFADSYMDLLSINIKDYTKPQLLRRVENTFQGFFNVTEARGLLVNYVKRAVNETVECNDPRLANNNWLFTNPNGTIFFDASTKANNASNVFSNAGRGAAPVGVGGSMARFTVVNNFMYAVDQNNLRTFTINALNNPTLVNTRNLGWGIETIFPYKDKLFIGSQTGMFIFDIATPEAPVQLGTFSHARRCDPVFVDSTTAYVTLRGGHECGGFTNQLDVVDVKNLRAPKLIKTYPMKNPKGLSILDKTLYLCDDGFKIFDIKNNLTINENQKAHIKDFDTFDVISFYQSNTQKIAMVIGADGFLQFDVTDPAQPKQLSKISVEKK
ncbi:MAG: hypothetical protein HC817_16270 [Saprospiraceae bacterium]|nr:hypothetical protein [Saprospiraceae bacterium]